jgi:hydrogenase maturation protease
MCVPNPKILVLELGNPILTDDGVGIHVARAELAQIGRRREESRPQEIVFTEASVGGLRLLEILVGYTRVILVDAIQTHGGQPGDICQLSPGDLRSSLHAGSTHDLFPARRVWGRQIGVALPDDNDILIVAIEAEDVLTFGESCTPAVSAAVPGAAHHVLELLGLGGA